MYFGEINRLANVGNRDIEALKLEFQTYLSDAINHMLGHDIGRTRFHNLSEYLTNDTDFFTAPASTQYHEAFEGGLCLHSLKVMNEALMLAKTPRFSDYSTGSALARVAICALLHDLCKVNRYEAYQRNVKNDITGAWEKVDAYRYKGDTFLPLGHGEKSMYMVKEFLPEINDEMALAIRWHMGLWECGTSADAHGNFSAACSRYPMVYIIQFADMLSVTEY